MSEREETPREEIANALQILTNIEGAPGRELYSIGVLLTYKERDAIVARLKSALAKLDGGAR